MCRQILFSGTCPQCTSHFVWQDLSQELSCLEAKNSGVFGQCAFGIQREEHQFDQECEPCAADNERDEGYCADGMDEITPPGEGLTANPTKTPFTSPMKLGLGLGNKGRKHADADADADDGVGEGEDGGRRKKRRVA